MYNLTTSILNELVSQAENNDRWAVAGAVGGALIAVTIALCIADCFCRKTKGQSVAAYAGGIVSAVSEPSSADNEIELETIPYADGSGPQGV